MRHGVVSFGALALLAACCTLLAMRPATAASDDLLPPGLTIEAPPPGIPREAAAFSGIWDGYLTEQIGIWPQTFAVNIAVKSLSGYRASLVVGYGATFYGAIAKSSPGVWYGAGSVDGGVISAGRYTLTLQSPLEMSATLTRGAVYHGILKKVQ